MGIEQGSASDKNLPTNARETQVQPLGWEGVLEEGHPLQYSCLENSMDRGAWWATVHGVAESWTWLKWLSIYVCMEPKVPGKVLLNSNNEKWFKILCVNSMWQVD